MKKTSLMFVMHTTFKKTYLPYSRCCGCTSHFAWLDDLSSSQWQPLELPNLPKSKYENYTKEGENTTPFGEYMLDLGWST